MFFLVYNLKKKNGAWKHTTWQCMTLMVIFSVSHYPSEAENVIYLLDDVNINFKARNRHENMLLFFALYELMCCTH